MARQTLLRILFSSLLLFITVEVAASTSDRQRYRQAREALRLGDFDRYQQLRQQLDAYPLAIYLDYYRLFESGKLANVNEAQAFISRVEKTPLARRARGIHLVGGGERVIGGGDDEGVECSRFGHGGVRERPRHIKLLFIQ